MRKKILSVFTIILFALNMVVLPAAHAQIGGKCGDNLTWTLDDNGVFTVSGTGEMYDYENGIIYTCITDLQQWQAVSNSISDIVVEEGVESIGKYAFLHFDNAKTVKLPSTLKHIDTCAFFYDSCLEKVIYNGSKSDWQKIDIVDTTVSVTSQMLGKILTYLAEDDANTGSSNVSVLINNKFLQSDQPAVIVNSRTLVPMRAIFEALDAQISWDGDSQTATATKGDITVSVSIGKNELIKNSQSISLDVAPQIISNRTMIPLRAVSEAFDCIVKWNNLKKYAIIIPKNQTPYRIEAKNNGETVATAHFNDMGQLTLIEGGTYNHEYFLPLFLNMNGNNFTEIYREMQTPIQFTYEDGYVTKISGHQGSNDKTYSYTYDDNGIITDFDYSSYLNNNIMYGGKSYNSDLFKHLPDIRPEFTHNSKGLLEKCISKDSSGNGFMEYDEKYNLTKFTIFAINRTFTYNDKQQLISMIEDVQGDPPKTITYEYINE